jgi:alkyldihydroxyacetonephosphate synthase
VSDSALTPASVDWAAVVSRLAAVVGRPNVLTDPETLDRYSADALTPYRAYYADSAFERLADVVVRPAGTPEVSQIVGFAQQNAIPLIPYGGGTGVMGGVLPVRGGILLDMSRMNRLLSVSVESMTADVQAGMVLENFYEGLAPYGLMPGHDPYSVPIATVAGTIPPMGSVTGLLPSAPWATRW